MMPDKPAPKPEENPYATLYQQTLGTPAQETIDTPSDMASQSLHVIGQGATDLLKGVGKSAIGLMSTGDEFARKHLPAVLTNSNMGFGPPANLDHVKEMATPHTPAQSAGKFLGDAAQFFIPGRAEDAVASKLPMLGKFAKPLMRAIGSEGVNEAQGGPTGLGALGSVAGEGIASGMKTIAPKIAETAMRIPGKDRAFGKTPGEAILEDTKGVLPETVGKSANESASRLTAQLEDLARQASVRPAVPPTIEGNPSVSLRPSRGVIGDAMGKARMQNAESVHGQLEPLSKTLNERFATGEQIPDTITPIDAVNLKRGFSKEHLGRWNPDQHGDVTAAGRGAYRALDSEIDKAVPEGADINQRISSLLPVSQAADKLERAPGFFQKTAGRVAAHTGAMTTGVGGAIAGGHVGGLPGAIVGGGLGLLTPEVAASPETQMMLARTMGNKTIQNAAAPILAGSGARAKNLRDYLREHE